MINDMKKCNDCGVENGFYSYGSDLLPRCDKCMLKYQQLRNCYNTTCIGDNCQGCGYEELEGFKCM